MHNTSMRPTLAIASTLSTVRLSPGGLHVWSSDKVSAPNRKTLGSNPALPSRENRLVGLVVKVSASRAEGSGFKSSLRQDFFGVESYQ